MKAFFMKCIWAIPWSVALHFSVSFLDLGAGSSMGDNVYFPQSL